MFYVNAVNYLQKGMKTQHKLIQAVITLLFTSLFVISVVPSRYHGILFEFSCYFSVIFNYFTT